MSFTGLEKSRKLQIRRRQNSTTKTGIIWRCWQCISNGKWMVRKINGALTTLSRQGLWSARKMFVSRLVRLWTDSICQSFRLASKIIPIKLLINKTIMTNTITMEELPPTNLLRNISLTQLGWSRVTMQRLERQSLLAFSSTFVEKINKKGTRLFQTISKSSYTLRQLWAKSSPNGSSTTNWSKLRKSICERWPRSIQSGS